MQKYILVQWPESQLLMNHERFNECLFIQNIEGHDNAGSSAYMCPEDLFNEIFDNNNKIERTEQETRTLNLIRKSSQTLIAGYLKENGRTEIPVSQLTKGMRPIVIEDHFDANNNFSLSSIGLNTDEVINVIAESRNGEKIVLEGQCIPTDLLLYLISLIKKDDEYIQMIIPN